MGMDTQEQHRKKTEVKRGGGKNKKKISKKTNSVCHGSIDQNGKSTRGKVKWRKNWRTKSCWGVGWFKKLTTNRKGGEPIMVATYKRQDTVGGVSSNMTTSPPAGKWVRQKGSGLLNGKGSSGRQTSEGSLSTEKMPW